MPRRRLIHRNAARSNHPERHLRQRQVIDPMFGVPEDLPFDLDQEMACVGAGPPKDWQTVYIQGRIRVEVHYGK
jgi:hypothetical protein